MAKFSKDGYVNYMKENIHIKSEYEYVKLWELIFPDTSISF